MLNVSDILRERYFFSSNGGYKVRYDIRDSVRFGNLNIVKDPPISKIDILFCRNLLIYFEKGLQITVLRKLDYALNPGGILVLGKAEAMPAPLSKHYSEIEKGSRIYIKD